MLKPNDMSLERFCRKPIVSVLPDATVSEISERMLQHHVGAVVVVSPSRAPLGIVTDRDIVCRVIAKDIDPHFVSASSVMTSPLLIARVSDAIDGAVVQMRKRGVRRLPIVTDDGVLTGLVSLDDLLVLFAGELGQASQVPRDNQGP